MSSSSRSSSFSFASSRRSFRRRSSNSGSSARTGREQSLGFRERRGIDDPVGLPGAAEPEEVAGEPVAHLDEVVEVHVAARPLVAHRQDVGVPVGFCGGSGAAGRAVEASEAARMAAATRMGSSVLP